MRSIMIDSQIAYCCSNTHDDNKIIINIYKLKTPISQILIAAVEWNAGRMPGMPECESVKSHSNISGICL